MMTNSASSQLDSPPTPTTGENNDLIIDIGNQQQGQNQPIYGELRVGNNALVVSRSSDDDDFDDYIPIDKPPLGYPALDFRPLLLQNWVLILTTTFFLSCLAAVATLTSLSRYQPTRLHLVRKPAHIAVSYAPGLVGTLTTLWYTAVVQTYNRIIPYVTMASVPRNMRNEERLMYDLNAIAVLAFRPAVILKLLRHGHWVTFFVNAMHVLLMFVLTPLKGGFIQITEDSEGWTTHASRGSGYALCTLYTLLIICMSGIFWQLWSVPTGLKWDPAPIAAQISLITSSNLFSAFRGMEYLHYNRISEIISEWGHTSGVLRLGYWQKRNKEKEDEIIYSVRFYRPDKGPQRSDQGAGPNLNVNDNPTWEHPAHKYPDFCLTQPYNLDIAPMNHNGDLVCSPQYLRYHIGHFYFSRPWCWSLRTIGLICLIISLLYMITGRIKTPFTIAPILTTDTDPNNVLGRWETGALFNFLPGFLFSTFNATFVFASLVTRLMQPIAGMDVSAGAPAEESVLVDYVSPDPVTAVYKALKAGHFRVAWVSLLGLTCAIVPVVAGRMFNRFQELDGSYTMILQPAAFYASFAFLCIYLVAQWFIVPPLQYRAPRVMYNLVDTVSLAYRSHMLECDEFTVSAQSVNYDELKKQVTAADRRFQFGMYYGTDGRMHIGFDVTERRLSNDCVVRPVDPFVTYITKRDKRRIRSLKREIRRSRRVKIVPAMRVILPNGETGRPHHQAPAAEDPNDPLRLQPSTGAAGQVRRRVTADVEAPT